MREMTRLSVKVESTSDRRLQREPRVREAQ